VGKKRGSKWSVHIKGIQLADGAYARQIYLTERTKVSILNQMVGIFHFHFQTGSYDRANTRLRTNIGRCRLLHWQAASICSVIKNHGTAWGTHHVLWELGSKCSFCSEVWFHPLYPRVEVQPYNWPSGASLKQHDEGDRCSVPDTYFSLSKQKTVHFLFLMPQKGLSAKIIDLYSQQEQFFCCVHLKYRTILLANI